MVKVEQNFKVGDVVTLKSGSPKMTVFKLDLHLTTFGENTGKFKDFYGLLDCQWFVNEELKSATFNQDALELVTLKV